MESFGRYTPHLVYSGARVWFYTCRYGEKTRECLYSAALYRNLCLSLFIARSYFDYDECTAYEQKEVLQYASSPRLVSIHGLLESTFMLFVTLKFLKVGPISLPWLLPQHSCLNPYSTIKVSLGQSKCLQPLRHATTQLTPPLRVFPIWKHLPVTRIPRNGLQGAQDTPVNSIKSRLLTLETERFEHVSLI